MERHSSTAAPAPSTAADATALPVPVQIPHKMEIKTIPVHTNVIAIALPPLLFFHKRTVFCGKPGIFPGHPCKPEYKLCHKYGKITVPHSFSHIYVKGGRIKLFCLSQ
jgi:hypothetical protein